MSAMPVMIVVLCVLAIAYRYYSAFLAAYAAALDDSRVTPAVALDDGQNYHPTNKWVLFGHHFAAISGAGPLIGPVLAIQFGYLPGLIWIVVGVCLAGAVQDMMVMAASVRHNGRSLAAIAREQMGGLVGGLVGITILFIVVIALAGLGIVVVKALGGEEAKLPVGGRLTFRGSAEDPHTLIWNQAADPAASATTVGVPSGATLHGPTGQLIKRYDESFRIRFPGSPSAAGLNPADFRQIDSEITLTLPAKSVRLIRGSSWGTFTIAATIPIALLVGLWMYKLRPGRVVEASVIGAGLTLAATVAGAYIPGSPLEPIFDLSREGITWTMAAYGFIASVLPVSLLLAPRDYISSFMKIGTIAILVVGVIIANPKLQAPAVNTVFADGGPTFPQGGIFPFVFICVMCGAVSGFHSLVASGTTPKMITQESHIRPIGYGAMLIEGLVGITALIAAASLPSRDYYDINVDLDKVAIYERDVQRVIAAQEAGEAAAHGSPAAAGRLAEIEKAVGEDLRGRTGGAVTLAVGIAEIFDRALGLGARWLSYWYHFAIMFEALFILTTIDAGTRIARFLLQENLGRIYEPFSRPDWLPGALLATGAVTLGWALLISAGSIQTIWPMFGIANQLLAVIALATVTTWLANTGRRRYMWVTLAPMLFVISTTTTAGFQLLTSGNPGTFRTMIETGLNKDNPNNTLVFQGVLNGGLVVLLLLSVAAVLVVSARKWIAAWQRGDGPSSPSSASVSG